MAMLPGTRLGPYEIVSPLGAGGMGEVYRARDTRLDRTVAIKVLSPHLSATPESRERFQRETRIISSLSHPNICTLYDVGSQDGIDYAVMEYLEGQTLAQRLEQGPMPLDSLLTCAIEIAGALAKAHREGVAHRDLKPGNIMLTKSGAKLLDFGLAKAVTPVAGLSTAATMTVAAPITAAGSFVGTCQYMAPEQIQGADADARSDIFAFGAVLYEMATGRKAFDGHTPISILSAILERQPEPIRTLRPVTPPELERLIQTCLAKDPDSRWQSAVDLKLQLESIRDSPGREAAPAPRTSRRELVPWALALVLLLTALGLWLFRSAPTTESLPVYRASLLPPPGMSFALFNFALSPDGKRLAFVAIAPDGRNTLWVRSLEARGAQQLADTENANYPFWAPDNRRIGFFAAGKLKIADTASGAIQTLCDSLTGGGAWNSQGTILFAGDVGGPLSRVSERGGKPQPVTELDPQGGKAHRWPWFLPDEKHFLFFQDWGSTTGPHPNGIYAGSLDGGPAKLISADASGSVAFASGHLLYFQDSSLMAQPFDPQRLNLTGPAVPVLDQEIQQDHALGRTNFSVSPNGVIVFQSLADSASELVWYTADGKEAGRIPDAGALTPSLSPDGRFLAVSSDEAHNGKRHIRVHDLQRGVATRLTDGGSEGYPVWSPDGKTIAYGATQGRTRQMYEIPADGSGKPELLLEGPRMHPNAYSPDGRYLIYMNFEKGPPEIAVYDRVERKSSPRGRGAEVQFSPDGKWITAAGYDSVHLQPFSGGGARLQISSGSGGQARWRGDGRKLYFLTPDRKMMEVPLDIRDGKPLLGAPRLLFQTHVTAPRFNDIQYDVTRDGSRFLVNSLKPEAPLTLVPGWPALLRR